MKNLFLYFCACYKFFIDPLLINSCRFSPTCSIYAVDAIIKYNMFFAGFLIFKRLFVCNKIFTGGYKPII